jgi:hypothetical protein
MPHFRNIVGKGSASRADASHVPRKPLQLIVLTKTFQIFSTLTSTSRTIFCTLHAIPTVLPIMARWWSSS